MVGTGLTGDNPAAPPYSNGPYTWDQEVRFEGVVFHANSFQYPAPGTDWTPAIKGATLAQSLSAKKVFLPLNFLKKGDKIVSYTLKGDVVEAATATLDCKLVKVTNADPTATADVAGGAITQIDADGDYASTATLTAKEEVAANAQYALEITGTTGAGDSIDVIGAEVVVDRVTIKDPNA